MNQSTIIFGFLFAAFVIYITQRGELPTYWGFLVSTPSTAPSGPTATATGSLDTTGLAKAASNIGTIGKALAAF